MRIMNFIDSENFKKNFRKIRYETGKDRFIDWHKINPFVLDYLKNHHFFCDQDYTFVRTYCYTGIYTPHLFKKIEDTLEGLTDNTKKKCLSERYEIAKKRLEGQKKLFNLARGFDFFEIKKKPLQFSKRTLSVIQKGVDVQLAVDLVSNAYLDNYDIAVIFSGDIDLLESIKTVKSLGKRVIILSHWKNMAKDMRNEADFFIDLQKIESKELDKFTHIFIRKE